MAEYGYRAKLELLQMNSNGDCSSFGEPLIELDMCSFSMACNVGPQGKIATDIRGGNISFMISRIPNNLFLSWAMESNRYLSGILHIVDFNDNPITKIMFETAACINLKITYMNEGTGYMVMEGILQAENLQLPGCDWLMNRWNNVESLSLGSTWASDYRRGQKEWQHEPNPNASLTASMVLGKYTYELQSFEMEFGQEVDHKGEPQSEVHGGFLKIGLYHLPDEQFNCWLMKRENLDGKILFGDEMIGYELNIGFKQARCAAYQVNIGYQAEKDAIANLAIVPDTLVVEDKIFKVK